MKQLVVRRSGPLRGRARVPGDKSIGHRALLLAALGEGTSTLEGLSGGLDNQSTAGALRAMGVTIEERGGQTTVHGVGLRGLRMPPGHLDCGNSGTTMRLIAGLLVAQHFGTRLVGDASLSRRPMKRIVEPLRARGGHIAGTARLESEDVYPPLSVAPLVEGEHLRGLEVELLIASAQVKSALLLSGLYARGLTAVREPTLSRDHTERMLSSLGVPIQRAAAMVVLDPTGWRGGWDGFAWTVPGDLSAAAFLIAAAMLVPGSAIEIENVGVNPTRTGLLDALRPMNATVDVMHSEETIGDEPVATLSVEPPKKVFGGRVGGELLTRMIDEVPAFASLAAAATGVTEIRDAAELRVKESDRLATMATVLRAFGAKVEEREDGLTIEGGAKLRAAHVDSRGDHRIAMAAACLGLAADGETVIDDVECIDTSFPRFAETLRELGGDIEVRS